MASSIAAEVEAFRRFRRAGMGSGIPTRKEAAVLYTAIGVVALVILIIILLRLV
jgi:hypothetical protein